MPPDLIAHLATNQLADFHIAGTCDRCIPAYLLGLSDELALFHPFRDFAPDGYMIVRTDDIEEVERKDSAPLWDHMLAGENLVSGLLNPPEIDLSSMHAAIADLTRRYAQLIVELDGDDLDEEIDDDDTETRTFFLGRVTDIHDDLIEMDHFDTLGVWTPEPAKIWISDIARIQFDTPYANIYAKYASPPPIRD